MSFVFVRSSVVSALSERQDELPLVRFDFFAAEQAPELTKDDEPRPSHDEPEADAEPPLKRQKLTASPRSCSLICYVQIIWRRLCLISSFCRILRV